MTDTRLPGATWRPVSYRSAAGTFPATPLGWILHVVVGNGSPWGTFENAPAGSRRFSTAWVAKDGHSEQYTELTGKSWAQGAGNPLYWAFETEGYPTEPLTDAQVTTLATWHDFLGVTDALAEAPGQRGIGTHYMGGSAWGGHTCPDPAPGAGPRSHQRTAILARAQALRTSGPVGGFGSGVGGSGTYTPISPIGSSTTAAPAPTIQEDDMLLTFDTAQGGYLVTDGGVTALNGQEWNLMSRLKAKNVAAGANPDAYAGADQFLPAEIDVIRAVLARVAPAAAASAGASVAIDYEALAKAVNDDAARRLAS